MRLLYPLLLIAVLAIVIKTIFETKVEASPQETARAFLQSVSRGDFKGTVKLFGGNVCRCPAKGGWVSYLIYSSAQEPNLAFAMGHPFRFRMGRTAPVEPPKKPAAGPMPWQKPEDVVIDADIAFSPDRYMPLFLPLKMAYGKEMTEKELDEFVMDPDRQAWKGFSLRLRPGLASGITKRPEASRGIEYHPRPGAKSHTLSPRELRKLIRKELELNGKTGTGEGRSETGKARGETARRSAQAPASAPPERRGAARQETARQETAPPSPAPGSSAPRSSGRAAARKERASDRPDDDDDSFIYAPIEELVKDTLGTEAAAYLQPRDAGPVIDSKGRSLPAPAVLARLPRLASVRIRLHVVRRGQLKRWTVYHFGLIDPVLVTGAGARIKLRHYLPEGDMLLPSALPRETGSRTESGLSPEER